VGLFVTGEEEGLVDGLEVVGSFEGLALGLAVGATVVGDEVQDGLGIQTWIGSKDQVKHKSAQKSHGLQQVLVSAQHCPVPPHCCVGLGVVGFPEGVRVVGGFIGAVVGVVEGDAVGLRVVGRLVFCVGLGLGHCFNFWLIQLSPSVEAQTATLCKLRLTFCCFHTRGPAKHEPHN